MKAAPKVSVLIPTYNYAHFLDEAIQSVLDQTFTDFELIIVDNCSTDNTDAVVRKYLTDNRVSFYKNEINIGIVGNWNKCLEYATGEYIKFLCADDKFRPRLLQKFVTVMDQHPEVSIISSYTQLFGSKDRFRKAPYTGQVSSRLAREELLKEGAGNWLRNPSAVMFRKANVQKVGTFHPQHHHSLDLEYYVRLLTVGDCYIIPEDLSCIRSHPNTESAIILKKKYDRIFENYRLMANVKGSTSVNDQLQAFINKQLQQRAIRAAAVMYEVLPTLYKKENRTNFKKAFQIGRSEGVLFAPLLRYIRWKYIRKLIGKK